MEWIEQSIILIDHWEILLYDLKIKSAEGAIMSNNYYKEYHVKRVDKRKVMTIDLMNIKMIPYISGFLRSCIKNLSKIIYEIWIHNSEKTK